MTNTAFIKLDPIDTLPEQTSLVDGHLLFTPAGSTQMYRMSLDTFTLLSQSVKILKLTDPAPTVDGLYRPESVGTYSNTGGLVAKNGYDTIFLRKGGVWSKSEFPYQQASNNLPQFANLSFPVTNTATEKVQCVDNFVPYQLLDGKTSTSADTPSTSPTIWKPLENRNLRIYEDLPNGTILNPKEQVISNNVQYIVLQQAVVGTDLPTGSKFKSMGSEKDLFNFFFDYKWKQGVKWHDEDSNNTGFVKSNSAKFPITIATNDVFAYTGKMVNVSPVGGHIYYRIPMSMIRGLSGFADKISFNLELVSTANTTNTRIFIKTVDASEVEMTRYSSSIVSATAGTVYNFNAANIDVSGSAAKYLVIHFQGGNAVPIKIGRVAVVANTTGALLENYDTNSRIETYFSQNLPQTTIKENNLYGSVYNDHLLLGKILRPETKQNLLQNRFIHQYSDIAYPATTAVSKGQLPFRFQSLASMSGGNLITDSNFIYKNNVVEKTATSNSNIVTIERIAGYNYIPNQLYVEFKIITKISLLDNNNVGVRITNTNGGGNIYTYRGVAVLGQQGNSSVSNVEIVYQKNINSTDVMQVWRLIYDSSLSGIIGFQIRSASSAENTYRIGDIVISESPIKDNVVYKSKPEMNDSKWIGKNIMVFGDSNLGVAYGSAIMNELGCNVFLNAVGGRAMKYRGDKATADEDWLYHWSRRQYIKTLFDAGITIDAFVFTVSYNDASGGGELSYAKISDVENNYPLISDDASTVTAKLALWNAMTDANRITMFNFQQTFASYIKQLIKLYPSAYIQLNKVMYSPAGNPEGTPNTNPDVQREADTARRDSLNSQLELIGKWFQVPVEDISKSTRYYFGNMTEYTPDTIHFTNQINTRLGSYVAKKMLMIDLTY